MNSVDPFPDCERNARLESLYRSYEEGKITRRAFMLGTVTLGLSASAVAGMLEAVSTPAGPPARQANRSLDLSEWSFFWVGVERADLARGTLVNGKQMYVEYQIPSQVRQPYPIVLVHGGGGQGLDWMGRPDGGPGWATYLLQEGYMVYVVDRPGHGRSPFHPELHGSFPPEHLTLEQISGAFTPQRANAPNASASARLHDQWPGTGAVGTPELAQMVAGQGGSYINPTSAAHADWRDRGAELLDKIGPALIMTHSAGGAFGWLVAEARPSLVKGIIVIEGGGGPFAGPNTWGLSTIPVTYAPPVSDPTEIETVRVESSEDGVAPYRLQVEPARRLPNLEGIPIAIVTAEASFASPGNPGQVAFLKQAGCTAEEIRLVDSGVRGNGHMLMSERNNRETLQPILDWIDANVPTAGVRPAARNSHPDAVPLRLSEQGHFFVGTEHKEMSYGTIISGQMFVQYLIPENRRHDIPVVLVHGGGGQGTHYMGLGNGHPGWAHYYLQEGYAVYIVDRPGHGRTVYHPDALGPIGAVRTYSALTPEFRRGAENPNPRWPGTGTIGDPLIDQFIAGQNSAPMNGTLAAQLWARDGAELLDRIGPAILQTHSAGGPFGWIVADQRPDLVRAIVCYEGAGAAFARRIPWGLTNIPLAYDPPASDPSEIATREVTARNGQTYRLQAEPARRLRNLQNIPIAIVTAEASGRNPEPPVEFLRQAGCTVEDIQLGNLGILGNSHFMMFETNNRETFDVIRGWIEKTVG